MKQMTFSADWQVTYAPNEDVVNNKFAPERVKDVLDSGYPTIPAMVPGNFELDLQKAGIIEDPYYSTNMITLQQYENRHLYYTATFERPDVHYKDGTLRLHFGAVDTVCDIFINGELMAHHDNMFTPIDIVCRDLHGWGNEILVHIYPVCIEARKFEGTPVLSALKYNYPSLYIRKAGYMFGWDIMPRAVSAGIWQPVVWQVIPKEHLKEVYIYPSYADRDNAHIEVFWSFGTDKDDLKELSIVVRGQCKDSHFERIIYPWHTFGRDEFDLQNPYLWWPKNYGEPHLYDVTVGLYRGDRLQDEKQIKLGVRTVKLDRTSTDDEEGNGEFCFRINGKKVFCLGTNWVPLDAYPSRHDARLSKALEMAEDIGVNMIRLWGGSIYESDAFFDFCDAHGIMVWHDFAMGCGHYPQDDDFVTKFRKEAEWEVKRVRNHASLVLWAGDNECDYGPWFENPNHNRLTREILPLVLEQEDPVRPYLPSSPYFDEEAVKTGKPTSEAHLWGPRDYFKGPYYTNTVCHFASETGYHGCPSPATIRKMMHDDQVWPIFDEKGNIRPDWLVKSSSVELEKGDPYAYRIPLMISQVKTMFGEMPETLERFSQLSQISQAEAFKFFIERFRLSMWRRTGIIWWNLLDGCPQISDAVVDYYYDKKSAYDYIKRSQAPLCMMFDEPKNKEQKLFAVNDTEHEVTLTWQVTEVKNDAVVMAGTSNVSSHTSLPVATISEREDFCVYAVRFKDEKGHAGINHFVTRLRDIDADAYISCLTKIYG